MGWPRDEGRRREKQNKTETCLGSTSMGSTSLGWLEPCVAYLSPCVSSLVSVTEDTSVESGVTRERSRHEKHV